MGIFVRIYSYSAKFCEIIFDLNLCQLISKPTHIHGNILDLVLTNNPDQLFDLTVHSMQPLSISSDHYVITFKIYSKNICSSNHSKTKLKNFSRGDFEGLCSYLSNYDFSCCYQSDDIESVWCFISSVIKEAIDLFVPSTVVHHDHQPKWFNSEIRHHINCLYTLRSIINILLILLNPRLRSQNHHCLPKLLMQKLIMKII